MIQGYPSLVYAGLGVVRRIEATLIVDLANYSVYNQLYSYQYFVGFLKSISKHIAVGTRFERRMFSELFEIDSFTKALLLDDEALNTWRRDVLLRFTFVYKW